MHFTVNVAAVALALGGANAWTFNVSNVTSSGDNGDGHQPLYRTWTISSFAQLQQLYLALPGRVFVELDPSLLPETDLPTSRSPSVPGVVSGVTPGAVPGFVPGKDPGFTPGSPSAESKDASSAKAAVVPGVVSGVTPGAVPGFVPGKEPGYIPGSPSAGSHLDKSVSDSTDSSLVSEAIEVPSVMLRKHHHHHYHNYEDDCNDHLHGEETFVAKIVVSGNSSDLLDRIEIAPLHPGRNDGLKLQLKNEDAVIEGYVLTQIYLFQKNMLHQVTTAFSGDVVLDDNVVMLDDAEADVKLACVGDGKLFLKSRSNATLSSLDVEVMGTGLVQLEIPSVNLEMKLDVEVAGTGVVALITDDLSADEVKCTLSGSGDIVVDTSNLEARKLQASVYGSGVASFATAGSVEKESLTLSGSGQLLAGSIVAAKANVDVWGNGEMLVQVTDKLTVLTSVWGKVGYVNAPPSEVKVKGWWFWRETSSIVYSAAVNKVAVYEPVAVPAKTPVYYSIKAMKSLLSDEPNCTSMSSGTSDMVDLITMSLAEVYQADATLTNAASTDAHGVFYALVGVGVIVVNVVAARSWSERRARRHYTTLM